MAASSNRQRRVPGFYQHVDRCLIGDGQLHRAALSYVSIRFQPISVRFVQRCVPSAGRRDRAGRRCHRRPSPPLQGGGGDRLRDLRGHPRRPRGGTKRLGSRDRHALRRPGGEGIANRPTRRADLPVSAARTPRRGLRGSPSAGHSWGRSSGPSSLSYCSQRSRAATTSYSGPASGSPSAAWPCWCCSFATAR